MIILVLTFLFLAISVIPRNPEQLSSHFSMLQSTKLIKHTITATPAPTDQDNSQSEPDPENQLTSPTPSPTLTATNTPTPTATPTIVPILYGCAMEIRFISGPMEGYSTTFTMVEREYFYDKGDKFDPGKNTGVFYEIQRYLILHSGYQYGNLSNPLEAEFIRKYLESWGNNNQDYVEGQIEALKGSEMIWICNNQEAVRVELVEVIRLSHEASSQLWLDPQNFNQIIADREGDASEWIGEMQQNVPPSVYISFCGWGPPTITANRSIYYRYIMRFEILN